MKQFVEQVRRSFEDTLIIAALLVEYLLKASERCYDVVVDFLADPFNRLLVVWFILLVMVMTQ